MQKNKPKSQLRRNIVILLIGLFIINLLAVSYVFNTFFIDKIEELTYESGQMQTEKFANALAFSTDYVARIAEDWGAWTATYDFLTQNDPDYLSENYTPEVLYSLQFDLALIINNQNDVVYSEMIDHDQWIMTSLPDDLLSIFLEALDNQPAEVKRGLLSFDDQLLIFAAHPIVRSDYSGEPAGTLLFAQFITDTELERYQDLLNLEFTVIKPAQNPELFSLLNQHQGFYQHIDKETGQLINFNLIYDFSNQPVAIVKTPSSFLAAQLAKDSVQLSFMVTIALMVTTLILVLFYFEKNLNQRLRLLTDEINDIGKGDFTKRVTTAEKSDEISFVTNSLNQMLDNLEKMKNILIDNEEKSYLLAYHDQLTGLPNRINFTEELEQRLLFSRETKEKMAVIFLDLDHFKLINDSLGHNKGDELLIQVADRLSAIDDQDMFLSRVSGDEFLVCFSGIINEQDMNQRVLKILDCFRSPFMIGNQEVFVSASVGVAMYPEDGTTSDILIKNADMAMYKAKEDGKNKFEFVTSDLKEDVYQKMKITNALFKALENNEFVLHYQPQYDMQKQKMTGLEALLRWNSKELGTISPAQFIPIAEQTHLIMVIGDWVLRQALSDIKKLNEGRQEPLKIAVNLSLKQFHNKGLARQIQHIIEETGMDPSLIDLEITESVSMIHNDYMMQMFADLKQTGVSISLDDFGTEYSSLSYIKQLPLDQIKIAMPFVQSIGINKKDEAIVRSIISICKNLGLEVLAEGVETKEQADFLYQENCFLMQGYYYAKPMAFQEICNMLKEETNQKK